MVKRAGADAGHEVVVKKSGGKHQHDEHGGAWKVAFADFCLALMCLFLVLWVLAARDKEELTMALAGGGSENMTMQGQGERMIGEYVPGALIPKQPISERPVEAPHGQEDATRMLQSPEELQELSRRVEAAGQQVGLSDHITTIVTAQGLRIMVHDTDSMGMFTIGSAQPSPRFAELLRRIGPMFATIDNQLVIAGHTDALQFQRTGPFGASNWSLSMGRAVAARAHMISGGMPERSVLQVIGMGEVAPVDPEHPNAPINRRVELLVTTKAHASNVLATFGPLPQRQALTPELQSSMTDTPLLDKLRQMLLQAGQAADGKPVVDAQPAGI